MAEPTIPEKAKLIAGIMYKDAEMLETSVFALVKEFGEIEERSAILDFNFTDYYEQEFGNDLKKAFVSFSLPVELDRLPDIKIFTNALEKELSGGDKRIINIDPGYITLDALILATCKPRPYRIYLGKGVYAHLTLIFKKNDFTTFTWTFADYKDARALEFFRKVRNSVLPSR